MKNNFGLLAFQIRNWSQILPYPRWNLTHSCWESVWAPCKVLGIKRQIYWILTDTYIALNVSRHSSKLCQLSAFASHTENFKTDLKPQPFSLLRILFRQQVELSSAGWFLLLVSSEITYSTKVIWWFPWSLKWLMLTCLAAGTGCWLGLLFLQASLGLLT